MVDVNQLYHLNKHLWLILLSTLTMNRKGVNREMKEKLIESFNLLIPAQTVCSDDGKKSFFSVNRNGLSAILDCFVGINLELSILLIWPRLIINYSISPLLLRDGK